jgi:phage N-6-adenine-methyltransferase
MSSARTGDGNDLWRTPDHVLNRIQCIAPIELDPCTSADNPTRAAAWITELDTPCGLTADWAENVGAGLAYVNPPYSRMAEWATKIATEALLGLPIVALVAARVDTRWWRTMWGCADVVGFWRGRIRFVVDGAAGNPAPFPSAVIGFNVGLRRFRAALDGAADVVVTS